ncbi:Galactose binding lectin domain-containing protein [Flavobacterium micromati]|uniref:Galactose binding lectin domain-containing protein n=1 Tax=Flavobacterium micromati TaxID=229205 RepID=A0A1M5LIY6_9FLAO|nr:T9SS sorting signal type C domain-containing protein [Flavobacterium micromati]SHG64926.1 Galactose binding lectin domain-containing protein [Flavobacterium micromati]
MNKKLLILLVLFFNAYLFQAQCSFPISTPQAPAREILTFCSDNPINNSITTVNSLFAGDYIAVNVVRGFTYSFIYPDTFPLEENLTIFDASNTSIVLSNGRSSTGANITWTSTISGLIYVLISRANCVNNRNSFSNNLTVTLNSIGNTQDSQAAFGTGNWIGHVYNWTGSAPPGGGSPASPSNINPFSASNYVGYYNVGTESFNENFGGDQVCFPVLSNGAIRTTINTETFAVRYRMRSNKPAGCYVMNVNGDDGVRVYIDGVLIFDRWVEQSNTTYCNNLVNLTANSEIVLDYYENGGQNVLGFSLLEFDGSGNNISSPQNVTVCSNTSTTLNASNLISCNINTNTVYQWQSSTNNINFTDISGATGQNYTAPGVTVTAGNPNNVRYFRRVFRPSTATTGTCVFNSNIITIKTSDARPNAPGAIIGSSTQCTNTTATFSIAAVPNAVSYEWRTGQTGWTIIPSTDGLSVSIAFSATATSGNLVVSASNGCGQSFSNVTTNIQVRQLPASASISGSNSVCVGAPPVPITFTNPQNYGVRVTYNINGGSNLVQFVGANTSINFVTAPTNVPGVFVYNLISVGNEIDFPSCSTSLTGTATVTVNSASTSPTAITGSTNICAGGSTLLTVSGGNLGVGATANWFTASCGGTLVGTGNSITVNPTATTMYFVRYEGSCGITTCISTTVTVNSSIINNNLSFTNGISGPISAVVDENGSALLNAPSGTYFATVNFASYGNPNGSAPNFTFGACNAVTSQSIAENALLGNSTATLRATNGTFGDPCVGTFKRLYILASYVQPICNGATVSISGSTPSGGSGTYAYQWQSSTTSATAGFTTATGTSTGINYISGAITRDTWFRRIATSCSTSNTSFVVLVKVNTAIPVPIITATTQPNCVTATGRVALGSLPATGTWTITTNPATAGLTGLTGTGLTTVITGLTANTNYTFTVFNGICSSLPSSAAILNSVITTTYNGTTWDNGIGLDKIGIINPPTAASITISSDVELCSCTVNAGKNLEIASGITLKLQDKLTVNGTLTFNDEASLVQINNVVNNSGAINYVRVKDNAVRVTDYTYYSSPVSLLKLAGSGGIAYNPSSHAGSRFFSWTANSTSGFWQAATASTTMEMGKGYIIRGPNTVPSTPLALLQATFTGVPNNGTITLPETIIANNFYLLGNPYPSALDADAFLAANNSVLNGTIYFWTHATEISNSGSGFLQYSSNDYAAYNGTGSIATRGNLVNNAQVESNKPNGKIAAGQGFFASSRAVPSASKIIFNNTMRVGVGGITGTNSQFFRTSKTNSKTTTGIEKNRIWLNLTNSGGAFKQLLVGYITGATNEYDSSFDGTTYNGNVYIDFYSLAADKNLTIQGRALPFSDSDLVPLGYVSKLAGEFSIAIDEVDGVLKSQDVFIEDKMLATVHDLKVAPYKFNTAIGTFSDRFVLRYTNRTLSTENFDIADSSIIVSKDRNELKVKSQIETIQRITIFNLLGKKVLDQNGINSTEFRSSNSNLTNQTAIVKITLTTGIVITKKVAF